VKFEQLTLDWCYSCWRAEPIPLSGAYLSCFECGHVFETASELEQLYKRLREPGMNTTPADLITFCPLCLHDF
jgi:hypothetical protein